LSYLTRRFWFHPPDAAVHVPRFLRILFRRRDADFSVNSKTSRYDLHTHCPALFDEGAPEKIARVKATTARRSPFASGLRHDWTKWAHSPRHDDAQPGARRPGHLLDTTAAADIPKWKFTAPTAKPMPMMKSAPSAAHLTAPSRVLESFTWMTAFQRDALAVKQAADFLFISGVTTFFTTAFRIRPPEAPWPGWQFYAAVNFGPQAASGTSCRSSTPTPAVQSVCKRPRRERRAVLPAVQRQMATPRPTLLMMFDTFRQWDGVRAVLPDRHELWKSRLRLDEVSDRFLASAKVVDGKIVMPR